MSDDVLPRHEHDLWRANTYHLLAKLLTEPPKHRLVTHLGTIPPLRKADEEHPIALAWAELGEAARRTCETSLFKEYLDLFGEKRGELIPRASWYLFGANDANRLSLLHEELSGLGVERCEGEAEDHAGALCETMYLLIDADDPRQIGFFYRHLASWLPAFFRDLRLTPSAMFYRSVGSLGETFLQIENEFFGE